MNFGIDDILNKTIFGIPEKDLKDAIEKLKEEVSIKSKTMRCMTVLLMKTKNDS